MKINKFLVCFLSTLAISNLALSEEIAIAIHVDPGHEMFEIGRKLKNAIEERSNGEFTVTLLGTEVGGERDHLEGASTGEYQIALGGSMPMSLYAPEFAASDLPFLYSSTEEARKVYEGELGEKVQEKLNTSAGLRLVGLSVRNPRNLTSKKPINSPQDIAKVRMRVPEIAPWIKVWTELGALPSPIAWPEVYTSLQTGVVEMQENPVDLIYASKLFEVQNYINKTEHVYSFFHWLMNDEFYNTLSEQEREMIQLSIDEAIVWGNETIISKQNEIYKKLEEEGMEVIELDVQLFRENAAKSIREIAESFDEDVKNYVLSYLNK